MSSFARTWVAAAAVFLLASAAFAQRVGGTVTGRVSDESGRTLAGASVSARNVATAIARTATSDAQGLYRFIELSVGTYEFTVASSGFATEVRSGVRIFIGQQAEINFVLKVATVAETVTVHADAPIVETTKSSIGATITTQQIDSLPLPERNFINLAFISPGITQSVTEATDISGSGSNGSSNTFLIDGLTNDQDALGDIRGDYSPDAIGEFEVMSSQYAAEYGQASGAIINVVTRSGGNDLHFRAAGYYRADGLTATNPFAHGADTPFDQWILSTNFSGPIVREKAFFFASYEQTWRDETAVVALNPALLASLGLPTETTFPRDLREPRVVAKADIHPADSQNLMLRFRLDEPKINNNSVGDIVAGRVLTSEGGFTSDIANTDYAAAHSWVITPSVLNEARFQYARQNNDLLQVNCPDCPTILRPSLISGKLPNFPQSFIENRYQFLDAASFTKLGWGGDHFFKVGADYSHVKVDAFVPQTFSGLFFFTTDDPYDPNNSDTHPFLYQKGSGDPNIDISTNMISLFVQDQWRVNQCLTLNLGLRWDYEDQVYVKNDWQNFGPRIHFAWDPTGEGRTSVRGGFGTYYDQVFLNVGLIASVFEPGRFNIQQFLFPGYPDPGGGGELPPSPPSVSVLNPDNTTPYKNVASLGVQHALTPDMAFSLDFVYARGYHLLMLIDDNAPVGGVYPDPNFTIKYDISTIGKSKYMAMQLGFTKRFGQNLGVQLAYTLASNKDNTDGHQYTPSDNRNPNADYGPSTNDIRNTLNAAFDWRGPWGIILGTSASFLSSPPYNITTGLDGNGDTYLTDRPPGEKRNGGRGESLWTINLRLAKVITIDRLNIQLIAEAFNLFNHINPTGYLGSQTAGSPPGSQFRQPTNVAPGAFGPRQIQFGLRFDL
jgi:Carboxypeptidase regulatory-like domain/TonB dependent receptor-like, beta-barrel